MTEAAARDSQPWVDFLTPQDLEVFAASGYGRRSRLTAPMAVLVVDVTYAFTGEPGLPLLESVERCPNSCGPSAWAAVDVLQGLIPGLRDSGVPVVYTTGAPYHDRLHDMSWGHKQARKPVDVAKANEIAEPIRPRPGDVVIAKTKPSAFFDTPLMQYLVGYGIRQLVVCGGSTSGCVRATVVDGFSYGFRVAVLPEATFDRGQASHAISLFDMQQKYADLISAEDLLAGTGEGEC